MREPTPELLAQAHAAIRQRDWPDTVEATLQGPHAGALRLAAWRLSRGHCITAPPPIQRSAVIAPQPPLFPELPPDRARRFDPKRAAAGDRDD